MFKQWYVLCDDVWRLAIIAKIRQITDPALIERAQIISEQPPVPDKVDHQKPQSPKEVPPAVNPEEQGGQSAEKD